MFAGLNADGRVLSRYMRSECLNHKFVFDSPLSVSRLVAQVADKSQVCTQRSWKRPYGVGLLVGGYDATGPHLFQTCPSGNYFEFYAMAIGSRSQAAKTYLERKYKTFPEASRDELIRHALHAVKESLQEGELTGKNCSLAIVGKGGKFEILEEESIQPYIDAMESSEMGDDKPDQPGPGAAGEGEAADVAVTDAPPVTAVAPSVAGGGQGTGTEGEKDEATPMEES